MAELPKENLWLLGLLGFWTAERRAAGMRQESGKRLVPAPG